MIDCEFDTLILSLVLIWIFYVFSFNLQLSTKRKLLKKIFNEFSFTKEIIIYTWGNDEEDIHLNLNTEQIKLISDIDINLSIIHYN